jgi:hypothetical protein
LVAQRRAPNRAALNAQTAVYKQANKEALKIKNAEYRAANQAKRLAYNAAYQKAVATKTPLEKHVEEHLCTEVERRGGMCPKFIDPSRRGAPDRIVMLPGHPSYFVELKRQRLGHLKSWQVRYHDDIRAAGQRVWVLKGDLDVDAFFAEVDLCL